MIYCTLFAILFTVINAHRLLLQGNCNPDSNDAGTGRNGDCEFLQNTVGSPLQLECDVATRQCTGLCTTTADCTPIDATLECVTGLINNQQTAQICRQRATTAAPGTTQAATTTGSGSAATTGSGSAATTTASGSATTSAAATTTSASGCDCGQRSTASPTWSCTFQGTCQADTSECNAFCTFKATLDIIRDANPGLPSDDVAFAGSCKNETCPTTTTAAATTTKAATTGSGTGSDTTSAATTTRSGSAATTTSAATTGSGTGSATTSAATTTRSGSSATTTAASGCDCGGRSTVSSTWSCDDPMANQCSEDTSECNTFCAMKAALDGYRLQYANDPTILAGIPDDDTAFQKCRNEACPIVTTAAATTTKAATTGSGTGSGTTSAAATTKAATTRSGSGTTSAATTTKAATTGSGSTATTTASGSATTTSASGCDCGGRSTVSSTWSCDDPMANQCREDTSECNTFCAMKEALDGYRLQYANEPTILAGIPDDDTAFQKCRNEACPIATTAAATTTKAATTGSGSDTTAAATTGSGSATTSSGSGTTRAATTGSGSATTSASGTTSAATTGSGTGSDTTKTATTGSGSDTTKATTTAAATTESECEAACSDDPDSAAPDGRACEVTQADLDVKIAAVKQFYPTATIVLEPVPCTETDNLCKSKCLVQELVDDAKTANPDYATAIDVGFNVETETPTYCPAGTCPTTTGSPNTATTGSGSSGSGTTTTSSGSSGSGTTTTSSGSSGSDTTTTAVLTCDNDDSYLRDDCPDTSGTGCSLQVNATLDFCILMRKYKRRQMYTMLKMPFVTIIHALPGFTSFCAESTLRIEVYKPEFSDDTTAKRGTTIPTTDTCPNPEDLCANKNSYGSKIIVNIGFFCGSCDDLKELQLKLLSLIDNGQLAIDYIEDCLGLSVDDDTICGLVNGKSRKGFGAMQVEKLSIALRDANGDVIGDKTDIFGNHAPTTYYYVGLCLVFIILSFLY